MHRSISRVLAIVIVLAGLPPAAITAQTPEPAEPEPEPSYEITVIGVGDVAPAAVATPSGDEDGVGVVHQVVSLAIDPGAAVPVLSGVRSAVLYVQDGRLRVTAVDGSASVSAGTGESIESVEDEGASCDPRSCELDAGQAVVLGPGNGFSLMDGSLTMEVTGDERAVVLISALLPASDVSERCWICPAQ